MVRRTTNGRAEVTKALPLRAVEPLRTHDVRARVGHIAVLDADLARAARSPAAARVLDARAGLGIAVRASAASNADARAAQAPREAVSVEAHEALLALDAFARIDVSNARGPARPRTARVVASATAERRRRARRVHVSHAALGSKHRPGAVGCVPEARPALCQPQPPFAARRERKHDERKHNPNNQRHDQTRPFSPTNSEGSKPIRARTDFQR